MQYINISQVSYYRPVILSSHTAEKLIILINKQNLQHVKVLMTKYFIHCLFQVVYLTSVGFGYCSNTHIYKEFPYFLNVKLQLPSQFKRLQLPVHIRVNYCPLWFCNFFMQKIQTKHHIFLDMSNRSFNYCPHLMT